MAPLLRTRGSFFPGLQPTGRPLCCTCACVIPTPAFDPHTITIVVFDRVKPQYCRLPDATPAAGWGNSQLPVR